jgi:transcriptional regulator with XRE-family HTH domain
VNKHFDAALGRRLRERREQLQLTLKDVAERCGVGYQLIHKYECGYVQISAYRLWQLALILKVQVGYFFRELDPAQLADAVPAAGKNGARKVNPA